MDLKLVIMVSSIGCEVVTNGHSCCKLTKRQHFNEHRTKFCCGNPVPAVMSENGLVRVYEDTCFLGVADFIDGQYIQSELLFTVISTFLHLIILSAGVNTRRSV